MGIANNITFCTYNIRGFNSTKVNYINHLLNRYDILLIEEHWLNDYQISTLAGHFHHHNVHGVSAMDSGVILQGRPHGGGCQILYRSTMGNKVRFILKLILNVCVHYVLTLLMYIRIYFVFICHVI